MNNDEFNAKINDLWAKTKAGKLPREQRFAAIERLIDDYIAANGKRPDSRQLDRLATLCLYEEMTDSHPDKMTREETPVMSGTQYKRRRKDESWRDEVEVGPAHATGKRSTWYADSNGGQQAGKNVYYLR